MINYQSIVNNLMSNQQALQNPIIANAVQMYRNGDRQGLNQLVNNLCKEKGIDPKQFFK